MPETVVAGPLCERHLADEARPHPRRHLHTRRILRRRGPYDVARQGILEPDALLGGKAGSDFSGVVQLAVLTFDREVKRSDFARRVRARIPSDDDELLL